MSRRAFLSGGPLLASQPRSHLGVAALIAGPPDVSLSMHQGHPSARLGEAVGGNLLSRWLSYGSPAATLARAGQAPVKRRRSAGQAPVKSRQGCARARGAEAAGGAPVALLAADRGAASAHACVPTPFIAGWSNGLSPWDSRDNGEFEGWGVRAESLPVGSTSTRCSACLREGTPAG